MAERVLRPSVARVAGPARVAGVAAALVLGALFALGARAQIQVPKPQGYVNDFANVIDEPTERRLEALIRELKQKTGAEIAVVTVRTTQPEPAFDYAMAIAEQWKPGDKDKDNGVVFLAAIDDRELQILTGYGVEGALPDGKVGEIRDTLVVPAFRAGDYSRGIADATTTMAALIAAEYGAKLSGAPEPVRPATRDRGGGGLGFLGILLLFLLVAGLLNALGGGGRRRGRRGRRGGFGAPIIFGGGMGGRGGFGGGFGGGGGGFGGFGGGGFGGGGAGGRW